MGRKKINNVYKYFVLNKSNGTAKCLVNGCEKVFKTLHGANLLKHLSNRHTMEHKQVSLLNDQNYGSQRKNRSQVWQHFEEEGDRRALCRYCSRSLSFRSTTANLKNHILRAHPDRYREYFEPTHTEDENEKKRRTSSEAAPLRGEAASAEWSDAWQHFSRTTGGAARCCVCCHTTAPTSERMLRHLKACHEHVWKQRRREQCSSGDETVCSSPARDSEVEDDKELPEDRLKDDKFATEVIYLNDEEKKEIEVKRERRRSQESDDALDSFVNYVKCLMKQLPPDASSQTQMEIINVILKAKMASDEAKKATSQAKRNIDAIPGNNMATTSRNKQRDEFNNNR